MPPKLNLVDRLYLAYLTGMAVLAIWSGRSGFRLALAHLVIAILILLLAAGSTRSSAARFLHSWYPLAMFIFSFEEVARYSLTVTPHWQDFRIIAFEQRIFGISPNIWFMRFASRPLSEFMDAGYFSYYPLFPVVAGLLYARQDKDRDREKRPFRLLVIRSVVMYLIAFALYLTFPLEGPRHALAGFQIPPPGWLFSWLVRLIQGGAGVHGNAMPSSHVALALLCALSAQRHLPRLAPILWVSVSLICLGAVYNGYHYLSDVVAGILVALTSAVVTRLMKDPISRSEQHITATHT